MNPEERYNLVVNHAFGGWHHVYGRKAFGGGWIFNVYGTVSTFDFNQLTKFVIACHVARVRGEIAQSGPGMLKILLHCRACKPDEWTAHHPSADDLVEMIRKLQAREQPEASA